ncbi:Acetyltransferase sirH [Hypsizygus marmoreus]|uniref:Acetyltransferase sirH n=1 Tax=Hypsizygus marmoreus TaxID=39966 RepID=A0A369JH72_HYPMA|nr:Acetyltransferase sirH [Hypsizygus marmoreus]
MAAISIDSLAPILMPVPQLLLVVGLVVKPSPYRWLLWPAIVGVASLLYPYTPNSEGITGVVLRAFDFLILTDVQHSFRHVGQKTAIADAPLWDRVKWSLKLSTSMRGIGWNFEPKAGLPPKPQLTRREFLVSRGLLVLLQGFMWDAMMLFVRRNTSFYGPSPPHAEHSFAWRAWCLIQFAVMSSSLLSGGYTMLAFLSVAAGFSEPNEWPHLFGNIFDAYTLRRFWGRTWHKVLHRTLTSHAKYVAHDILRLTPGHTLSFYVQLYTAFLVSGIIHMHGLSDVRVLRFFLSQAVAITCEGAVLALGRGLGFSSQSWLLRCMGYVWVFCWLVYAMPPWWDSMKDTGVFDQGRGFSVLLGLYRGEWFPAD